MRIDVVEHRKEIRDSIDQKLIEFIGLSGFNSILVPNLIKDENIQLENENKQLNNWLNEIGIEGVVLSGGNNIGEFPIRDKLEYALINYALKRGIPLLGICRGMQVLASWSGVDLSPVKDHIKTRIDITGEITQNVNSFHEFVISQCPNNFSILAKCNHGTIQAIKHITLPWEGWMWHPEREKPFKKYDINRFKEIFN